MPDIIELLIAFYFLNLGLFALWLTGECLLKLVQLTRYVLDLINGVDTTADDYHEFQWRFILED